MNDTGARLEGDGLARPGWYHGWTIVAVLVLSQVAANCLTYNAFPLFLKGWSAEMRAPVSHLVAAITAMVAVAAPLSPIIGSWADRYPARRLFGIGLAGMAAFYVAVSFASQPWQIVVLYGAVAAPSLTMCTAVPGNALISRWFVRHIGLALGLSAFGIGLGGVIAPPLVAKLMPLVGWRVIWRVMGAVVLVLVLPLVVAVIRDRPGERDGDHYLIADAEAAGAGAIGHGHGGGAGDSGGLGWRDVFARPNFWMLVAIYLLILGGGSAFVQNMGPLAAARGLGPQQAGLMLAAVGGAHVLATLVMGLACDRFGTRLPLAGLALTVGAGLLLMATAHGLPALVLGAALLGVNAGVMTPLGAGIAAEFGPVGFGRAFGAAMLFLPVNTPLAILVARTQEHTGSYTPALLGAAAMQLLAAVLAMMMRVRHGGDDAA